MAQQVEPKMNQRKGSVGAVLPSWVAASAATGRGFDVAAARGGGRWGDRKDQAGN